MSPYPSLEKKAFISPRALFVSVFCILLALFAFSRAFNMLYGPRIAIASPADGATVASEVVSISGKVKNAALIHLNGRKIYTDAEGLFSEKVILSHGYNIISLSAKDRFGNEKEVPIHLIYQ